MKKLLLLSLSILVLGSCTQDENFQTETARTTEDLTTMLPNRSLDDSERGTYSGVVVANDTKFHGKLYLNIGNNDSRNEAIVESNRGDRLVFGFTEKNGSVYSFAGTRGSFDVDVSDISLVNTSNVIIDNTEGQVRVRKETNGTKNMIILGTFDDSVIAGFTGTWDFMVDAGTAPFISEVVYTHTGGIMISDFAADMEIADAGCTVGGVTAPYHLVDGPNGIWDLIAVGQVLINENRRIQYDFNFSKGFLDFNTLAYTQGGGLFPIMHELLFGGAPTGTCYAYPAHGYYLVDDGVAYIAGGVITFDASIVPPPPAPLTSDQASQLPIAILSESLPEL